MTIKLLDSARREFLEAVHFYESQVPRLGQELTDEFVNTLELLASQPQMGAQYLEDTRRVLLGRFPFDVVYVVESDVILVVALAHHRRQPGYWEGRR